MTGYGRENATTEESNDDRLRPWKSGDNRKVATKIYYYYYYFAPTVPLFHINTGWWIQVFKTHYVISKTVPVLNSHVLKIPSGRGGSGGSSTHSCTRHSMKVWSASSTRCFRESTPSIQEGNRVPEPVWTLLIGKNLLALLEIKTRSSSPQLLAVPTDVRLAPSDSNHLCMPSFVARTKAPLQKSVFVTSSQ
jgi:hypothetical protein